MLSADLQHSVDVHLRRRAAARHGHDLPAQAHLIRQGLPEQGPFFAALSVARSQFRGIFSVVSSVFQSASTQARLHEQEKMKTAKEKERKRKEVEEIEKRREEEQLAIQLERERQDLA